MMTKRDAQLSIVIEKIPNLDSNHQTRAEELFQNEVIRPILKFQHEAFIILVHQSIGFFIKKDLSQVDPHFLNKKINGQISRNQKLRNQLLGMVLGHMTSSQLRDYFSNESEYRKRIFTMLTARILDGLQNAG